MMSTANLAPDALSPRYMAETGQTKDPLRAACAQCIKELIWRFGIHFRPRKRPICLYASRRSGSTLLMQMIGVNRGVLFSDQPFGIYTASSANINLLPVFSYGQVACPDATEEAILRTFVHGLLTGRIRANLPWKFWSREFHVWNDRICLKITDAKAMADWIEREFDVQTVVLTRHPIAQAVSVARNRWLNTGKGLLNNTGYVSQWLNDDLVAFCHEMYRHGSDMEQRVTDWALENLPLLAMLRQRPQWLYISYEDLLLYPATVVDLLADRLHLPDRRAMLARCKRPSRSTRRESTAETRQMIHQQDPLRLLNTWKHQVRDDDVQAGFQILNRFGIQLYQADRDLPDPRQVAREPLEALAHGEGGSR